MLCWKLGEPRSGVTLFADVVEAVLMVVVHRLVVPLGQALGGLVTRNASDSARFLTWCITPVEVKKKKKNYALLHHESVRNQIKCVMILIDF